MESLARLAPLDEKGVLVTVVIEAPRGSRTKPKYDDSIGAFRLNKVLPEGFAFPHDFGFVPSTCGPDGDPLDVLVFAPEALFTGCVATVRLLGVLDAEQTEDGKTERNDRLIGAVETPTRPAELSRLDELPRRRIEEIEEFFVSYNRAQGRSMRFLGRRDSAAALERIREGMKSFEDANRGTRARAG
jgi:inorganic pyrophosphatase